MIWVMIDKRATMDHLGLIPHFLDEGDPRPAKEQIHENYAHGGGWHPVSGFKMTAGKALVYPGDPPMQPLAATQLRNETIVVYTYGYTAIIQEDGTFEVSRLD